MVADRLGALGELRTLDAMTAAFADEDRCRDVLEALVWPDGAVCPFCSGRNCRRRGGQDYAKGRWRCGEGACRASFTVTSRTPLHATKLPLSVWLKGLWLVLWSDKGVSSPRLAEFLGVTQATAWLLGHRLRLLMRHLNQPLDGTVEADLLQVGGKPRFDPAQPEARKGKQGHTTKRPVLTAVARPEGDRPGAAAATPVPGGGAEDLAPALEALVEAEARLLTDQAAAFATLGKVRDRHETVNHSAKEFVRGDVHVNTVEAWHDRFRRTIVGVYHHPS
jgi:transposase-like protein